MVFHRELRTRLPLSALRTPTTSGTAALTAQVTDSTGATATSAAVNVTVGGTGGPAVALTSPSPGRIVSVGASVALSANAFPGVGATVSAVEFLVNNSVVASGVTTDATTYTATWRPSIAVSAAITARVIDSNISTATSSPAVSVTVVAAPTIFIVAPTAATVGTQVTLNASTTVGTGLTLTGVEFFANGTSIGNATLSGSTWMLNWTPSPSGVTQLTARVTDSSGTTVTSSAFPVTVTGGLPPLNVVISPLSSSVIPSGSSRAVTVTASGGSGLYDRVELYYDVTLVGTDTSAPYNFLFTAPSELGAHFLTARVVDSTGIFATSAAVAINLTQPVGVAPVVAIVTPASGSFLGINTVTTITGTASDSDGLISTVQVFVNGAVYRQRDPFRPCVGD